MASWSPLPKPHATLFSIGYEGRDLDGFLDTLQTNRITMLADVRLTPISRKKGFSKRSLLEALASRGIGYRHFPELGNPKDNRAAFQAAAVTRGRQRYRAYLNNGSRGAFTELVGLTQTETVAVLCFEHDDRQCHRGCITDQAQEEHVSLSVRIL